jgi:hypothetical protein
LNPPSSAKITETPIADFWIDKNILCIKARNVTRTGNNVKKHYELLLSHVTTPRPWLLDLSICQQFDIDTRTVIYRNLPQICSALAIISPTPCSKMMVNYFRKMEALGIPVMSFEEEHKAWRWLKETVY